jgi:hypothetical protein
MKIELTPPFGENKKLFRWDDYLLKNKLEPALLSILRQVRAERYNRRLCVVPQSRLVCGSAYDLLFVTGKTVYPLSKIVYSHFQRPDHPFKPGMKLETACVTDPSYIGPTTIR